MFNAIKTAVVGILVGLGLMSNSLGGLSTFMPVQGGTGTNSIPTYGQVLVGTSGGVYTPTATSSLGISISGGWSTTSNTYWKSVTDLFSTTSANYFADSSTTIAKAYSSNTWTGANAFSTLPSLGTLTGDIGANNGVLYAIATNTVSCTGSVSCTTFVEEGTAPITITGAVYGDSNVNSYINGSSTIPKTYTANTFTALQSWSQSSSTVMSSFQNASTTQLSQGGHPVYSIYTIYNSIPLATSTDEINKFGTCLRQGGTSFTITSVDTLIASTSADVLYSTNKEGIAWNMNIEANTSTTAPMTAFTAVQYSVGTTSIQSFTPNSTVTVPANYCFHFAPTLASTTQIQMFYWNVNGYNN